MSHLFFELRANQQAVELTSTLCCRLQTSREIIDEENRARNDAVETKITSMGAAPRGGLLPLHVRRGVPEISADTSLDTSIARRHAIAAASSQCLIRAGTSASARRAPARRTPVPCAGGPSRTCSACSCLDFFIIIVVVGVPRLLFNINILLLVLATH